MKSIIFVALFSLCYAFPMPSDEQQPQVLVNQVVPESQNGPVVENQAQNVPHQWWRDGSAGGNAGGAEQGHGLARKTLKAQIQANKGQIKQYLLHIFKAFMPKEAVDKWFSLSKKDRKCLTDAQQALGVFWLGGLINSEETWILRLKQACPSVSTEIDAWHANCSANREEAQANWTETYNKLPESVQNVITDLNETFEALRQNGTFLARDKDAIEAAFLPRLQEFIDVPRQDWDTTVQVFPQLEVILGSNGNLTADFFILVKAAYEFLSTGNVTNKVQVQEAQQAFKEYGKNAWQQWAPILKEKVDSAQEQEFSPEAQSALETAIDDGLNTAEQHAPLAESHLPEAATA